MSEPGSENDAGFLYRWRVPTQINRLPFREAGSYRTIRATAPGKR